MPRYAFTDQIPAEFTEKAKEFIKQFQLSPKAAFNYHAEPRPEDVVQFGKIPPLYKRLAKFPVAISRIIKDRRQEFHAGRANPLWFQFFIQFWDFVKIFEGWRAQTQVKFFDIQSIEQVPPRFIYFPLHVAPELTLTTYAPFFEDQLRALDLVLLNMPANCYLVVKEHPKMKGIRKSAFYEYLHTKAGVMIASYEVPGIELARRALTTVSITGTAALEAMFIGKPSLVMGENFFAPWVGQLDRFQKFDEQLLQNIAQTPEELYEKACDLLSRIYHVGYDYLLYDPHDPSLEWKNLMNKTNLTNFLDGLMDHIKRMEVYTNRQKEGVC